MQKTPNKVLSLTNKFSSNRALAKKLWEILPENAQNELNHDSLATKIGLINQDKTTWWVKRPEISQCLADLLGVPIEDLGIHQSLSNNLIYFEAFPALPPIDLDKEGLFPLGEAHGMFVEFNMGFKFHELKKKAFDIGLWLKTSNTFRTPNTKSWIQVTDKSLVKYLNAYLTTYSKFPVAQIHKLEDLKQFEKKYTPQIFFIDEIYDLSELAFIQNKHNEHGYLEHGLLIISYSDKNLQNQLKKHRDTELEKAKNQLLGPDSEDTEIYTWEKPRNWKYKLIKWVEERISKYDIDTLLDVDAIHDWLKDFDEEENWFSSVDEVLSLCQIVHTRGEKKLPKKNSKTAGEELYSIVFTEKNDDFDSVFQMIKNLWENDKYDWGDSFKKELTNSQSKTDLYEILNRNPIQMVDKEKLERLFSNQLPDVQPLIENKLVKTIAAGHFSISQQSVFNLIARDCVLYDLANNIEETLWIFFDASRVNLAKACLGSLEIDELFDLTEKAVEINKNNHVAIGLLECLFIELSKNIIDCEQAIFQKNQKTIKALFDSFIWFENDYENCFILLDHKNDEWELACFYWSSIDNLNFLDNDHSAFPGWINNYESDHYNWLYPPKQTNNRFHDLEQKWQNALRVAHRIATKHQNPLKSSSELLNFTYIINASNGQYEINPKWWVTVDKYRSDWETEYFENLLLNSEQLSNQAVIKMLGSYYEYLDNSEKGDRYSNYAYSRIVSALLERLEKFQNFAEIPEKLLDKIELFYKHNDKHHYLFEFIFTRHFKNGVLSNLEASEIIEKFGIKTADYLPDLLKHELKLEFYEDAYDSQVANYYWRWCENEALDAVYSGYKKLEKISLQRLIWMCPEKHTQVAYDKIAMLNLFEQNETSKWLNARLKNAKRLAETYFNVHEFDDE